MEFECEQEGGFYENVLDCGRRYRLGMREVEKLFLRKWEFVFGREGVGCYGKVCVMLMLQWGVQIVCWNKVCMLEIFGRLQKLIIVGGGWEIVFVLWGMNDFLGLVGGELGGGCREGG